MYKLIRLMRRALSFLLETCGLFEAGIRITEQSIQYFEAWRGPGGFRIRLFIEDPDYDRQNIEFSLSRLFQKKGGLLPWSISTTIESKGVISRILHIPHVPRSRIPASVLWESRKHLPIDPAGVVYDYQLLGSTIEEGRQAWRVLFVAAKKNEVDEALGALTRFGLRIKAVRYLPLAFVNQFQPNPNDTSIAYVAFEDRTVYINILEKDRLLLNNISFQRSQKAVTHHVVEILKQFIEQRVSLLERVVLPFGYDELALEVMDALNIMVATESREDLAVPIGDELFTRGRAPFLFSVLRRRQIAINLLPADRRALIRSDRMLNTAVLAGSAVFALLFVIFLQMQAGARSLPPETIRNLEWIKDFRKSMDAMNEEISSLATLKRNTSRWNRVLAGVARTIEEQGLSGQLWLLRLATTRERSGYLEGVAFTAAQVNIFLKALEQFEPLSGVEIEHTKPVTLQNRNCVAFRIKFKV